MAKLTLPRRELTHAQIAHRAFEIYVARGGDHGHDMGDWFEAERQLVAEFSHSKPAGTRTPSARRGSGPKKG
jgi:Protein of unknown function (DUF2934)